MHGFYYGDIFSPQHQCDEKSRKKHIPLFPREVWMLEQIVKLVNMTEVTSILGAYLMQRVHGKSFIKYCPWFFFLDTPTASSATLFQYFADLLT